MLSACKVLVDPSGNYSIEFDKKEIVKPGSPIGENGCGISNCHGAEITCGDPVEMCTEEYQLGDFCRGFGSCEVKDGNCLVAASPEYTGCVSCAEECNKISDPREAFACETKCRSKFK